MAPIGAAKFGNHPVSYEKSQSHPDFDDFMQRAERIKAEYRPEIDAVFAAAVTYTIFLAGARIGEARIRALAGVVTAVIIAVPVMLARTTGWTAIEAGTWVAGYVALESGIPAGIAAGVATGSAILIGERILAGR
jgi:hypothetical protein